MLIWYYFTVGLAALLAASLLFVRRHPRSCRSLAVVVAVLSLGLAVWSWRVELPVYRRAAACSAFAVVFVNFVRVGSGRYRVRPLGLTPGASGTILRPSLPRSRASHG